VLTADNAVRLNPVDATQTGVKNLGRAVDKMTKEWTEERAAGASSSTKALVSLRERCPVLTIRRTR